MYTQIVTHTRDKHKEDGIHLGETQMKNGLTDVGSQRYTETARKCFNMVNLANSVVHGLFVVDSSYIQTPTFCCRRPKQYTDLFT